MQIRRLDPSDCPAVAELVNADRLLGQPFCTPEMVQEAADGYSPVDSGWWEELRDVVVEVAEDATGTVCGAVGYATRALDSAGLILCLHGQEDPDVIALLVDHALDRLGDCPQIEAFAFATALSGGAGLEALPFRRRSITDSTLRSRGFRAKNLWRYMRRPLPTVGVPVVTDGLVVESTGTTSWRLTVGRRGKTVATAEVGMVEDRIGVLWWLHVEPHARRQGIGRRLLGSSLDLLDSVGATQAILYVDDDVPGGERDRTAANRLYDWARFAEIDRLFSYQRTKSLAGSRLA